MHFVVRNSALSYLLYCTLITTLQCTMQCAVWDNRKRLLAWRIPLLIRRKTASLLGKMKMPPPLETGRPRNQAAFHLNCAWKCSATKVTPLWTANGMTWLVQLSALASFAPWSKLHADFSTIDMICLFCLRNITIKKYFIYYYKRETTSKYITTCTELSHSRSSGFFYDSN